MKSILVLTITFMLSTFSSNANAQLLGVCAHVAFSVLGSHAPTSLFDHYAKELKEALSQAPSKTPDPDLPRFLLKSPNPEHRLIAMEYTHYLNALDRNLLLERLNDDSPEISTRAAHKFATSFSDLPLDKASVVPLAKALMSPRPYVRAAALRILSHRSDQHSLAAIKYAIFNIDRNKLSQLSWPEFYALKLGALDAFAGRTDSGAVKLIDNILSNYFKQPPQIPDEDITRTWEDKLLQTLLFIKRNGSIDTQQLISKIVYQREAYEKWTDCALSLLRTEDTPKIFAATPLYTELVSLPGEPAEERWGRLDFYFGSPENKHIVILRQEPTRRWWDRL